MLRFAVVLLAFSFALSAQAQQPQPPAPAPAKPAAKKSSQPKGAPAQPQASGPCVGVISSVGEAFAVKKIGFTVFGNEYKEISASEFKLDELIVERVQAVVGRSFVARRIAHAKGSFDTYHAGGFGLGNSDAAARVRQVAGAAKCERYVVANRGVAQYIGNQSIAGVGIVNSGAAFLSNTVVHVVVRLTLHDGHSFEVLKSGMAGTSSLTILSGAPSRLLKDFKWPEAPEEVNTPAVRATTRSLLAEVLDKSLPELFGRQ